MALREEIAYVLSNVVVARGESLTDHPLAVRLRGAAADQVRAIVADDSYKIEGSPGKGNWAETVWISVFDKLVTETAQQGFYVVYLFRRDGAAVHLSLNQGTTAVLREAGRSRYLDVLTDQAARDAGLIATEDLNELDIGPISLDGHTDLSKGYEAGNICSRTYLAGALPGEGELRDDLTRFLVLYAALVSARDSLDADSHGSGKSAEAFLEAQRYSWHRRAERNNALAAKAKRIHGTECQVCEIVLSEVYGDVGEGYIEAHHLTPFASLNGRPTALDPTSDFAVVCPNCHRMLHRGPPYTLAELRDRMGL